MKPEPVPLRDATHPDEVVRRVLHTRLREARALADGLMQRDRQGLHAFRIACKRLRYALERFCDFDPSLGPAAERIALLQDALGEAHDRDVLLAILPPAMATTERRLQAGRETCVDRAIALWREMKPILDALDSHPI